MSALGALVMMAVMMPAELARLFDPPPPPPAPEGAVKMKKETRPPRVT